MACWLLGSVCFASLAARLVGWQFESVLISLLIFCCCCYYVYYAPLLKGYKKHSECSKFKLHVVINLCVKLLKFKSTYELVGGRSAGGK